MYGQLRRDSSVTALSTLLDATSCTYSGCLGESEAETRTKESLRLTLNESKYKVGVYNASGM